MRAADDIFVLQGEAVVLQRRMLTTVAMRRRPSA